MYAIVITDKVWLRGSGLRGRVSRRPFAPVFFYSHVKEPARRALTGS